MIETFCPVCAILPTNNPVFETKYWMVSPNPDQAYLGRCFVTLKNHKPDLSHLSDEEWRDLQGVIQKYEACVKNAFDADLCNWVCLNNDAYQEEPATPHVHWHVRPRYSKPVLFAGEKYSDPDFAHHYSRDRHQKVSEETIDAIRGAMQSALQVGD